MYSNSKEQVSLEEAYRMVHVVNEEKEECDCGEECHCGDTEWCKKCDKPKDECECVKEESYLSEGIAADTISWLKNKLINLTNNIHGLETKSALYIDQVLGYPEIRAAIAKQQELEKSHDMQDIIKAHNMKIELNELAGEDLIRRLHGQSAHALHRALKNQLKETEQEVKRR